MIRSLLLILLIIIGMYFAYKIIKSLIKVMIIGFIILLAFASITGFLFYNDFKDIKSLGDEQKLFLLYDEEISAAAIVTDWDSNAIIIEELADIDSLYQAGQFKNLRGNYSRVIVFDAGFFEEVPDEEAFAESVKGRIDDKGTSYLYDQYMDGNLQVIPKTIVFYAAEWAPSWLVKPILWIIA